MKQIIGVSAMLMGSVAAYAAAAQTEIKVLRVQPGDQEQAFYQRVEEQYEADHPDVDVVFKFIANEAYKSKLPTLLQSDARPDILYSWGGQTLVEQAEAGFLQPIGDMVPQETLETFPEAALNAYTVDGKLYGLPLYATEVIFWVNTDLTDQAGVRLQPDQDLGRFQGCRAAAQGGRRHSDHRRRAGQVAAPLLLELSRAA